MKFVLAIGCLLLLYGCSAVSHPSDIAVISDTQPLLSKRVYRVSHGEVQVFVGSPVATDYPVIPAMRLAEALRHYPREKTFRLSWESWMSNFSYKSWVIYNRESGELMYRSSSILADIDGKGAVVTKWKVNHSKVNDKLIYQLAKSDVADYQGGGFATSIKGAHLNSHKSWTRRNRS